MMHGDVSVRKGRLLEDMEDGSLSDWTGTNPVTASNDQQLKGDWNLESTSASGGAGHSSVSTTRGNWYRTWYKDTSGSGGGDGWILFGVQDANNPIADCYDIRVQANNDAFDISVRDSSGGSHPSASASVTIDPGTVYVVDQKYGPTGNTDNIQAILRDSSLNQLASVSISSDFHTGGTIGVYSGNNAGDKWDHWREWSI